MCVVRGCVRGVRRAGQSVARSDRLAAAVCCHGSGLLPEPRFLHLDRSDKSFMAIRPY